MPPFASAPAPATFSMLAFTGSQLFWTRFPQLYFNKVYDEASVGLCLTSVSERASFCSIHDAEAGHPQGVWRCKFSRRRCRTSMHPRGPSFWSLGASPGNPMGVRKGGDRILGFRRQFYVAEPASVILCVMFLLQH